MSNLQMTIKNLYRMREIALKNGLLRCQDFLEKPYSIIYMDYVYAACYLLRVKPKELDNCKNAILWKTCFLIDQDISTLKSMSN